MKKFMSWLGCWVDILKMKLMFWREGAPIPRRKSCHCAELFVCTGCRRELDFNKLELKPLKGHLVFWTCPHCDYVSKSLQCPSCGCLSSIKVAQGEGSWTCTTCLAAHKISSNRVS